MPGRASIRVGAVLALALLGASARSASAQGAARPGAARWRLVPEVRIGSVDGPDALSRVTAIALDSAGHAYVTQPMDSRIRVYSASGRLLRTLGGRGGGPGEFMDVSALGWRADTLVALDGSQQRLVLFAPDLTPARTLRLTPVGDAISTLSDGLLANGLVLGHMRWGDYSKPDAPPISLVAYRTAGEAVDTLARVDGHGGGGCMVFAEERVRSCFVRPVMSDDLYRLDPGGRSLTVVMRPVPTHGQPAGAGVYRVDLGGDTIMRSTLSARAMPVPTAWRDSAVEARRKGLARLPMLSPKMIQRIVAEGLAIPDDYPLVRALLVATGGDTWLRLYDDGSRGGHWLVLDPAGRERASVSGPAGTTLLAVRGDAVWGVERDELDVPYVVRYRIAKGAPVRPGR